MSNKQQPPKPRTLTLKPLEVIAISEQLQKKIDAIRQRRYVDIGTAKKGHLPQ